MSNKIWDKRHSTKELIIGYAKCAGLLILLCGAICLCFTAAAGGANWIKGETRKSYESWTKINPQYQLTYDQWFALYRADLLPTQNNVNLNPKTEDN